MTAAQADDSFSPLDPDETLDVREYLRVLWHDKWRILATALVLGFVLGLVGAVFLNARFRSTASLAMDPVALVQLLDTTGAERDFQQDLAAEVQTANSNEVTSAVDDALGYGYTFTARPTEGSSASLDFEVSSDSSAHASEAMQTLLDKYIAKRIELGVAAVDEQIAPVQAQLDDLTAGRADASAPLDDVNRQLQENPSAADQAALVAQQANLQGQLGDTLNNFDDQIAANESTLQRLQGIRDTIEGGSNQQVTHGPETTQSTPGGSRLAVIGLVLGLLIGVVISVGRRVLDKSVRTKSQLEHVTGQRVIGLVPRIVDWVEGDPVQTIALDHPTSPPAEAYRTLRTSLHFLTVDRAVRRMLVTSSVAGEGKTTTVANLAVTLARSGQRVLMVDADLRKPRLNEFFGLPNPEGLSTALLGAPAAGLIQAVPGVEGLSLLTAGPALADSAEHLGSDRVAAVLSELDARADLIIFDAPPLLPVADALVLSRQVDGVLLIASAGKTQPKEVRRATELLLQVRASLLGCVLNSVSREMGDGYAFEYGYELDERPTAPGDEATTETADPDPETDPDDGSESEVV